jgi:protein ImuB
VLARFGAPGHRFHALARGIDPAPPGLVTPPADLAEHVELDPPAERVDSAAFAAKGHADRLLARLAARGLACTRVRIEAETEHGERLARCWRLTGTYGVVTPAALAQRVRWQLDGWITTGETTAGLTRLVLAPDEVVPAGGRQLGFWGGDQGAHDRADRALARVQGMLGHGAVVTAVVQGGRTSAEQVRWVPWSEPREPRLPLAAGSEIPAWPGSLPPPYPARVFDPPVPAELVDARGDPVVVSGRGEQYRAPARICSRVLPGRSGAVRAWAGPWAHDTRWWDARARDRCARWQIVAECEGREVACIVAVAGGHAVIEAIYD